MTTTEARPSSWAAYAATATAFVFAAVSLYWAVGGTTGLGTIGGKMEVLARARDTTVVAATWGAFVLKVLGGLLALALVRPWGRRAPRRALLVCAVAGSVVLVLYGVSQTVGIVLVALDVADNSGDLSQGAIRWRMFLWEPWFLVWGVLLAIAARRASPTSVVSYPDAS